MHVSLSKEKNQRIALTLAKTSTALVDDLTSRDTGVDGKMHMAIDLRTRMKGQESLM